ncbi:NYN domain-containing protein [Clostridium disporicum]|uniref:Tetracycline resistance protein n=1 Tax=Clostridium disporicum TaxID=84024 RepID=A0A174INS9_9CLOT|nr:NYN domain-containing protein [Clostridium disporicum]CUO86625.1 tetracycline resistance protein [Clostridium disporicum]
MKIIFVDGYNVINSWSNLKREKEISLDSARQKLVDILHNYGAINRCKIVIVYDGHRVTGNIENKYEHNKNLLVVFTKDRETADAYIEREVHNLGRRFEVYVVTSDSLEQQTIFQRGAVRISSIEFYNLVRVDIENVKKNSKKVHVSAKNTLEDNLDEDVLKKLEAIRRS